MRGISREYVGRGTRSGRRASDGIPAAASDLAGIGLESERSDFLHTDFIFFFINTVYMPLLHVV